MHTTGSFMLLFALPLLAFASAPFYESDSALRALFFPGLFLAVLGFIFLTVDSDERWRAWAECESGVTTIERNAATLVIDDCDDYYRYPGANDA